MRMPTDKYNKAYIIAAKDDLSGTTEARALKSASADEVARFFYEEIICRYGIPESITTDNGSEFKAAFNKMCRQYGLPQIRISPYNSQANGVVERGHFVLREAIVRACEGDLKEWSLALPAALFADRITVKSTTGYSPYQLLYGTDPILPLDLFESTFLAGQFHANMTEEDQLAQRIRQLRKLPEEMFHASELLKKARFKSKVHFEKRFHHRVRTPRFRQGQLVLVRNTAIEKSLQQKQFPRYLGPYQVIRKNQGGAYHLAEIHGAPLSEAVAAFRLTPYIHRNHWFMRSDSRLEETSDESYDSESPDTEGSQARSSATPLHKLSDDILDDIDESA
jgi:transposase InsO family protein